MKARLDKRETDDGLFSVEPDVPLGKVYEVRRGSHQTATFYNTTHRVTHSKDVVRVRDVNGRWAIFPSELLAIEECEYADNWCLSHNVPDDAGHAFDRGILKTLD